MPGTRLGGAEQNNHGWTELLCSVPQSRPRQLQLSALEADDPLQLVPPGAIVSNLFRRADARVVPKTLECPVEPFFAHVHNVVKHGFCQAITLRCELQRAKHERSGVISERPTPVALLVVTELDSPANRIERIQRSEWRFERSRGDFAVRSQLAREALFDLRLDRLGVATFASALERTSRGDLTVAHIA
jgi:hypothetical protein